MSSGGCSDQPISSSVLAEGFGMLRTVTSDFKAAGHEVTVLLDNRISRLSPPLKSDCAVPIFRLQEVKNFLSNIADTTDAVLIVAPETGQILHSLVNVVEKSGKVSLNCQSRAISRVANKAILYQVLDKNHLPIPKTLDLSVNDDLTEVKKAIRTKLSYPIILKPANGVSCSGLSIVKEESRLKQAIEKIDVESVEEHFVVQEFIEGEAVSVSLLCANGKALSISLNQQSIKVGAPEDASCYLGGLVPFDHPFMQKAFAISEKVVGSFKGLRGYVGVDLVLAKDAVFVVDVNPRLTTSYVGLSQVANFNVAEATVNAIMKDEFPVKPRATGYVFFSKFEIPKPTINVFQEIAQIDEVISPPFPLDDNKEACGLIAGKGKSSQDAMTHLEEAKKQVLNIISRGK